MSTRFCIMKSRGTIAPYIMTDIAESLQYNGHEVMVFDMNAAGMYEPDHGQGGDQILRDLVDQLKTFKPDFLFSYGSGGIISLGNSENPTNVCEHLRIPYVMLFFDGPFDNADVLSAFAQSDLLYVTCWDRAYIDWLSSFGLKNVFYLPLATNTRHFRPIDTGENRQQYDISFIGSLNDRILETGLAPNSDLAAIQKNYLSLKLANICHPFEMLWEKAIETIPDTKRSAFAQFQQTDGYQQFQHDTIAYSDALYRKTCIESLKGLDHASHVFGNKGWEESRCANIHHHRPVDYFDETPSIYQDSTINLNLTNSHLISALNQRVFDVSACAGFTLSDYRPDLDQLFPAGLVPSFSEIRELNEKAGHFLTHEEERRDIARQLHEITVRQHSWDRRVKQLCEDFLF